MMIRSCRYIFRVCFCLCSSYSIHNHGGTWNKRPNSRRNSSFHEPVIAMSFKRAIQRARSVEFFVYSLVLFYHQCGSVPSYITINKYLVSVFSKEDCVWISWFVSSTESMTLWSLSSLLSVHCHAFLSLCIIMAQKDIQLFLNKGKIIYSSHDLTLWIVIILSASQKPKLTKKKRWEKNHQSPVTIKSNSRS